jgi:hypothetical protein
MNDIPRKNDRCTTAIILRDAALALLEKRGKPTEGSEDSIWFEQPTPENPEPYLSVNLSRHPLDGHPSLNVWGTLRGKFGKVLNIGWMGEDIYLVSFRRGGWESELLAMGGALGAAVH